MPVRVVVDEAAIERLARRDDVAAAIGERAVKIADAARSRGIMVDGEPGEIPLPVESAVEIQGGSARGVVYVPHPAGLAVESKHRLLGGSIDAAR